MRGFRADGRELYLELVEHTKRLVKLGFDVWHVGAECIFVSAAVVALKYSHWSCTSTRPGNNAAGWVASRTLMLVKASLSELSIARQLLRSSASFSCCIRVKELIG